MHIQLKHIFYPIISIVVIKNLHSSFVPSLSKTLNKVTTKSIKNYV